MIISIYGLTLFVKNTFQLIPFKSVLLIQMTGIIILGYLLIPDWRCVTSRLFILAWSFCLSLACIIVVLSYRPELELSYLIHSSLAIFFLSCFLLSLSRVMMISCPNKSIVPSTILALFLLIVMLPIWLAPWVELWVTTVDSIHGIIWSSPLTYLATVLDYDYLRSQWFYQHTPYGMFRYEYPNVFGCHLFIAIMSALLLTIKNKSESVVV